ncbi:MAG TPA: hypothetical protein DIW43_01205 [Spongiibacteraceae bacterium]|nr:hypothetical protein [Spongiibacteraceae bacterium]HCS26038.1 hypothetical protein [Spongiibacteraceae bacterium]
MMKQKRTAPILVATCITFSALMSVQAIAQPAVGGLATAGGGAEMLGGSFANSSMSSNDSGAGSFSEADAPRAEAPEQGGGTDPGQGDSSSEPLPGLEPSGEQEGEATAQEESPESAVASNDGEQPNRFDGGVTVRQETQGEAFTPDDGDLSEARNPSVFERHTVAEDHSSVRTCAAAGEVCQAEFDVIVATSDESQYDSAVLINDEQVLPPPEE